MKQYIILFFVIIGLSSFNENKEPRVCTGEAYDKYAAHLFNEVNQARSNPKKYGRKIGVDLSAHKPMHALVYDKVLEKEAQERAYVVANMGYLNHDGANVYHSESLAMNSDDDIKLLVRDKGVRSLGHRYHVLGYKQNSKDTKIGMGFSIDSKGNTYFCLITE